MKKGKNRFGPGRGKRISGRSLARGTAKALTPLLSLLLLVFMAFPSGGLRAQAGDAPPPAQWIEVREFEGKVGLRWIGDPGYISVRVERREEGKEFVPVAQERGTSWVDERVERGKAYSYRLVAVGAGGTGLPSETRKITLTPLEEVSPPTWYGSLVLDDGVGLKWKTEPGEKSLATNIYRRLEGKREYTLIGSSTATSYRDRALEIGKTYDYVLTSLSVDFRESPYSDELKVHFAPRRESARSEEGLELRWRTRKTRLVEVVWGGKEYFSWPTDVAVGPISGDLYLADSGHNRIFVFDGSGRYLREVDSRRKEGRFGFKRLAGITVDDREIIHAVDSGSAAIFSLNSGGALQERVDLASYGPFSQTGLSDLAPTTDGRLFVVDNFNGRLLLVDGPSPVRIIGESGYGPGQFSAPTFCTVDGEGRLFLSDSLNGRVQVFDAEGEFALAFGRYGRGIGGLARPKGVAVNERGEVYVADSWQNVIQVFNAKGEFVAVLTDESGNLLDLGSPNGIALGGDNRIYIAERLSKRLQIREIVDER